MDDFEWDPDKAEANLRKHGISFEDAALALIGAALTQQSRRGEESRFQSFCVLEGEIISVAWTPRANAIRILSARRAKRDERQRYRETLRRSAEGR